MKNSLWLHSAVVFGPAFVNLILRSLVNGVKTSFYRCFGDDMG